MNQVELPPQLRQIRDFYFKEALTLPAERLYLHRPGLIKDQTIFRLEDLREYLNNPFLDLDYLQFALRGQQLDLREARCFKYVQHRKIEFVNRQVLQKHLQDGAACVLEGVDVLNPQINMLATALDRAHLTTFCNAVVFFSQRGNEAYLGHFDTDDVLVVHLAGTKKWRLHRRLPARRSNTFDLPDAEMGPVETELILRPGDVMFVRSGTPHRVETIDEFSMHVSFDLCDRTINVETAMQLLLKRYDLESLRPHSGTGEMLEKVTEVSRSEEFRRELDALQRQHKTSCEEFRSLVRSNRVSYLDRFMSKSVRDPVQ